MTVLRGEIAVVHPDGSAVQPAPTGTTVTAGDEIRTTGSSGALITFFVGTEIELAEQTTMVVERVSKQGDVIDVSLKQVLGASLERVQRFSNPGSSVRIDAGGAVSLIRGTSFVLVGPTQNGLVAVACTEDCDSRTTFAGCALSPYMGYWIQVDKGRPVSRCEPARVDRSAGPWNAAYDILTQAAQTLQGNFNGIPAGQFPAGNQMEGRGRAGEGRNDHGQDSSPPSVVSPGSQLVPSPGPLTGNGTVTGTVVNANNALPISGATVRLAGGSSTTTGANGQFTLTGLPTGQQTLIVSAAGFVTDQPIVNVPPTGSANITVALVPIGAAGDVKLVLVWDAQPRDLDSHLSGPAPGSGRFHLAFFAANPVSYASLDVDDTNGNGPETVTIRTGDANFQPGEYRYWVHNFSGEVSFPASFPDGRVTVTKGSSQLASYKLSDASGDSSLRLWFVVKLAIDAGGNVNLAPVQQFQSGDSGTQL